MKDIKQLEETIINKQLTERLNQKVDKLHCEDTSSLPLHNRIIKFQ